MYRETAIPKNPTTRIGEKDGKAKVGIEVIIIFNDMYVLKDLNIIWQGFARQLNTVIPLLVLKVSSQSEMLAFLTSHEFLFKD